MGSSRLPLMSAVYCTARSPLMKAYAPGAATLLSSAAMSFMLRTTVRRVVLMVSARLTLLALAAIALSSELANACVAATGTKPAASVSDNVVPTSAVAIRLGSAECVCMEGS